MRRPNKSRSQESVNTASLSCLPPEVCETGQKPGQSGLVLHKAFGQLCVAKPVSRALPLLSAKREGSSIKSADKVSGLLHRARGFTFGETSSLGMSSLAVMPVMLTASSCSAAVWCYQPLELGKENAFIKTTAWGWVDGR